MSSRPSALPRPVPMPEAPLYAITGDLGRDEIERISKGARGGFRRACASGSRRDHAAPHVPGAPVELPELRRVALAWGLSLVWDGHAMTEDTLGVWCRGKLPDGTPCRSVEVVVAQTSRRLEGIMRLRRCRKCGARLMTIERVFATTARSAIRWAYPPEVGSIKKSAPGFLIEEQRRQDARRAYADNRRARKIGAPGRHHASEWRSLLDSYHGMCVYCLSPASTRDHVVSLVSGGGNGIDNIVPACLVCNSSKGAKPLIAWLATRAA